jgi:adenylate cyclase
MAQQIVQRRLAAILAADVVGYSRMMQADEAGILAILKSRRTEILQPLVSKHRGRVVKLMGDGVLIEFASAVDAVTCAVELQEAMVAANADLEEGRQIVLRMGINLGDIIVEGNDLYGDGVNVAARLEAVAEPGTICISQTVYQHVKGKVQFRFDDLGERNLKNIDGPLQLYRLSAAAPASHAGVTTKITGPPKPSVAVLPFTNMSGDPEQEYFSDGITEDIITDLSRVSALLVVARNTSFTFKGRAVEIGQAARQMKVSYVLEGSVRKSGGRVRITAQLIDASSGGHVWAERYDRDFGDIFALQDEISKSVVAALKVKLLPEELEVIVDRSTTNPEAFIATIFWADRCYSALGGASPLCTARAKCLQRPSSLIPATPVRTPASPIAMRISGRRGTAAFPSRRCLPIALRLWNRLLTWLKPMPQRAMRSTWRGMQTRPSKC